MSQRGPMSALAAAAIAAALGLCALTSCSLAPRYAVPSAPAAAPRYSRAGGDWKLARPADKIPRGPWWRRFGDTRLDALEARVASSNQDIKASFARLMQARAETRIARAGLLPQISATAGATRARTSINSPRFPATAAPVANDFSLQGDLSYQIDAWGRIRNSVLEARAGEQASADDLATLELSIRATLAIDYFTLRGEDAQIALLDGTVAEYARALTLTRNLYRGGDAVAADVAQARAQLESARTAAADMRLARAQSADAIATLVGANPTVFRIPADPLPLGAKPPPVDPGLPSTLLERRPDIAAAERRVAAANAAIGVARAAYFPVFDLVATVGLDSASAASWLQASSRMWSLGAAGALSVFDAGLHRAESAAAHARYDELVADYRSTVIGAYQDVEDQLAALAMLARESHSESAAVAATRIAMHQAGYRYQAGIATYLEVASTETAALQARAAAITIETRRLNASVSLIEALGGGWRDSH